MRSHTTKLALAAIAVSVSAKKITVTVDDGEPALYLDLANDRSRLNGLELGVCKSMIVERHPEDVYLFGSSDPHSIIESETIGCYDVCSLEHGELIRVESGMFNWPSFADGFITEALAPGSVYNGLPHDGGHAAHSYHCWFEKSKNQDLFEVKTGEQLRPES